MSARDEAVELAFLERAARHDLLVKSASGHAAFVTHARDRLAAGELTFGDAWAGRTVEELLVELLEEAADLGAWGALAKQLLDEDDLRDRRIAGVLAVAAWHGAWAHRALAHALKIAREG